MIKTALSSRSQRYFCDSGTHEVPVFGLDDNGDVIITGSTDLFAQIQSHKDEVLLDKIIARCALTGETLTCSDDSFGDSTILPKDLLEAKTQALKVDSFKSGLSSEDLSFLMEKGFDDFLKYKIEQAQSAAQSSAQSEVKDE